MPEVWVSLPYLGQHGTPNLKQKLDISHRMFVLGKGCPVPNSSPRSCKGLFFGSNHPPVRRGNSTHVAAVSLKLFHLSKIFSTVSLLLKLRLTGEGQ